MAPDLGADVEALAAAFTPELLRWFAVDGRKDLPWQQDPTPYRVWISEIMLQQTQVATVAGYFSRFMDRFPDVQSLANARLDEVLHLWSGLGYYARARNLHRAARVIVREHGSEFPRTIEDVMELPGIGRSTAGAILALSRGERHPILDGNVKRVLARYFAVTGFPADSAVERQLWELADACTPAAQAGEYTQAIMDLGATICSRSRPACLLCPVNANCMARLRNLQDQLPSPRPRASRPQRSTWVVIAMRGPRKVLVERRPPSGIWGGMWGLPEFPTREHAEQWCHENLSGVGAARRSDTLRHAFSHFDLEMRPIVVSCLGKAEELRDDDRYRWYDVASPAKVGLPRPIATLIARHQPQQEP